MEDTFYMIYVEGGHAPNFVHDLMANAMIEAKRLAKLTNKKVYILEAIQSVQFREFDIQNMKILPF